MELQPYLAAVGEDLARATALADEHTRETAHRVGTALEPALRLALVQALSDAAATVTSQLQGAVVTVRMNGRDPELHVESVPDESAAPTDDITLTSGASAGEPSDEAGDTARVTVRLPEPLKRQAESQAAQADQSLNTWIVAAIRRATSATSAPSTPRTSARRVTGWA